MATQTFRVTRDENMDVRYGGTSFGNVTNTSKTKKNARVGLKPLSDITNSGIPSDIKVSRKNLAIKANDKVHYLQNLNIGCEGACVARGSSNVPESQKKTDRSGRRALVDISNSKKLSPKNASDAEKKNGPGGRRALTDISNLKKLSSHQSKALYSKKLDNIAEECFLHNHQECIDSQRRGLDLQTFFTGLDDDFLVGLRTPPILSKTKSKVDFASPPRNMEYLDVPELLNEVELPPNERIDTIPSPCSSRYASPKFDLLKSP